MAAVSRKTYPSLVRAERIIQSLSRPNHEKRFLLEVVSTMFLCDHSEYYVWHVVSLCLCFCGRVPASLSGVTGNEFGQITFVFETICSADCELYFMMVCVLRWVLSRAVVIRCNFTRQPEVSCLFPAVL